MSLRFGAAARAAGVAIAAALSLWSRAVEAEAPRSTHGVIERLSAVTVDLSTIGRPGADRVEIAIERWSSGRERKTLIAALLDRGPQALLGALQKMPRVGSIRRAGGGLGWDLRFARQQKLADGGRQIVLATDRPMRAWEGTRLRSADDEFILADIRFADDGTGVGKLSVAAKVGVNVRTGLVEIEDFGSQPVRLTQVTSDRAPRARR